MKKRVARKRCRTIRQRVTGNFFGNVCVKLVVPKASKKALRVINRF